MSLRSFLTCVICLDFLRPSSGLGLCVNGHLTCSECFERLRGGPCPSCRVPHMSLHQNHYILKGIHSLVCNNLVLPCPFATAGCPLTVVEKDMEAHVKDCTFRTYQCPKRLCFVLRTWPDMSSAPCLDHYKIVRSSSREAGWSTDIFFSQFYRHQVSVPF